MYSLNLEGWSMWLGWTESSVHWIQVGTSCEKVDGSLEMWVDSLPIVLGRDFGRAPWSICEDRNPLADLVPPSYAESELQTRQNKTCNQSH